MRNNVVVEAEVLIQVAQWLVKEDRCAIRAISPYPPSEADWVIAALREAGVDLGPMALQPRRPDLVAERRERVWSVECKGVGVGSKQPCGTTTTERLRASSPTSSSVTGRNCALRWLSRITQTTGAS